ncbi:hypothetical protein [Halorarum salinum]|uniref:Uncharacterized protein n=1 Tax=Halorarum salinum TaxID=2743089 RepID=A0A7D5QAV8_9EURY|nr:hypothetical protein [Halobaculum salinum]QLG61300.1 hypothetical protein HUG12_05940 [Halobaculum salinum]
MSVRDPGSAEIGIVPESPTRYDLLLAGIPLLVLSGLLLGTTGAVPLAVGAAIGSALAASLVGYALFVAVPGGPRSRPEN